MSTQKYRPRNGPAYTLIAAAGALFALAGALRAAESDTVAAVKARLGVITAYRSAKPEDAIRARSGGSATLPLWEYSADSNRDGAVYSGVMVGTDPSAPGVSTKIPAYIVPLILTTGTIVTGVNSDGSMVEKANVSTTFDPSVSDACLNTRLSAVQLTEESPVFQSAAFAFGGRLFETTQYVDAFQRGNFWSLIAKNGGDYHVLLNPVKQLPAVHVSVNAASGTALPPDITGSCSWFGNVDIQWFDNLLKTSLLPQLAAAGVNPAALPIFVIHNVVFTEGDPASAPACCILGYHSTTTPGLQTYVVADFDTTQLFSSAAQDSAPLSHEIAEWVNDPFGTNLVPAWGIGEQTQCQSDLEVGDPLARNDPYRILASNGFTYHLQELANFSWFFGGPSTAANGWYSNGATFLTDAGPVCQDVPSMTGSLWHFSERTPAMQ